MFNHAARILSEARLSNLSFFVLFNSVSVLLLVLLLRAFGLRGKYPI